MPSRIFYHPHYWALPLPERHRFPLAKYLGLHRQLTALGHDLALATPISRDRLEAVHDRGYVASAIEGRLGPSAVRQLGFPWSPLLVERTLLSVGATLAACHHALEQGCGLQISGGYHHAHPGHGSGFCLFNDLVVAARSCLDEERCDRVLIVDLDVHQGDGSAALCAGQQDIITLSLHGEHNFPRIKSHSHFDFPLASGTGDQAYLATLKEALSLALRLHRPDLILYQAGVDVHRDDELGYLALTETGIRARDALVLGEAKALGIPVAAVPGGGYRRDWRQLIPLHMSLFEQARQLFG